MTVYPETPEELWACAEIVFARDDPNMISTKAQVREACEQAITKLRGAARIHGKREAMTNKSEPTPEPIDKDPAYVLLNPGTHFTTLNLRDDATEQVFLADIAATFSAPSAEPGHLRLSRFVYDLARRIEAVNMQADTLSVQQYPPSKFLEELLAMIATAPLAGEYAAKLAYAPPADIKGTGPHKLVQVSNPDNWAWCGGPGLCRWCTQGGS